MVALAVLSLLTCPFIPSGARLVSRRGAVVRGFNSSFLEDVSVDKGAVDAIYTFGAPGVASPAIANQRTQSGCWNGLRVYLSQERLAFGQWYGDYVDPVPSGTNYAEYWHSKMPARQVDTKKLDLYKTMECTAPGVTEQPPAFPGTPNANLHLSARYLQTVMELGNRSLEDFAVFGLVAAYDHDVAQVANLARTRGWKLVGTAEDDGDGFLQGAQVSHLFQKPETLECVISFKGTDPGNGKADWDANIDTNPEKFCGLVDEDEECGSSYSACQVKPGSSFVHRGFANRARSIGRTDSFNSTIRGNLHACSKVSVVGHSAGGAVAELVAACLSKTLAPDAFGYDDRSLFGWVPSTPVELPEVSG